ncbi:hypothetical protein XH92_35330 [Bradyrhizobium sp. CCBAU 53421]|nr:hypothetical protein XH92_35330 [Bradyrhizobium sp. CCBAU 53421]
MLRELAFEKLTSVKRLRNAPTEKALTSAESCCAFSIHLCLAQARARCRPDAARRKNKELPAVHRERP